jgi:uncharacterized integral membrane protein
MNAKTLFRSIVILLLLFVVLYVGMENTHRIDFNFPVLLEKKISQPAALLFFAMFAVGVIVGMVLNSNTGTGGGEAEPRKKK